MGMTLMRGDFIRERHKPIVDVVVSVGFTPPSGGHPVNTDRLYILHPACTETVSRGGTMGGRRDFAKGFDGINDSGKGGLTEITGTLMHAKIDDAIASGLACVKPPKRGVPAPPGQQMWCSSTGDGIARRWGKTDSGELGWKDGPCAGQACPFYASKTQCKAHASATFTLRLEGYPNVRAFWSTHGIGTMRNIKTWVTSVEREWAEHMRLGPAHETPMWWLGMPIKIWVDKVKRKHGETGDPQKDWKKYPEVQIVNAVPLDDWFKRLRDDMKQIRADLGEISTGQLAAPRAVDAHHQLEPHGRTTLSGGRLLSPAPLVLGDHDDDTQPEAITLAEGTPTDADGWPTCPECTGQMDRALHGFKCCDSHCVGARNPDGSTS